MFKKSFTKCYLILVLSLMMLLGAITPGVAMAQTGKGTASGQQTKVKTKKSQKLKLDNNVASMTEKRTLHAAFKLPQGVDVKSLSWTYDGKPLSQWKKYKVRDYSGAPFITVSHVKVTNGKVHANINFDLPYDTDNLSEPRLQRPLYASLMGTYDLAATVNGRVVAHAPVKLTPYDSFRTYDELKPEIDAVTAKAAQKNNRYIKRLLLENRSKAVISI